MRHEKIWFGANNLYFNLKTEIKIKRGRGNLVVLYIFDEGMERSKEGIEMETFLNNVDFLWFSLWLSTCGLLLSYCRLS